MSRKMLIDAAHPEETRVVVVDSNRVEDFDFESATKKQIRGNIYLAKVTRVEPSLQAAFVEYGGNKHGFLAFNEIHPDYYQIPHADREALREAEAALEAEIQKEADAAPDIGEDGSGEEAPEDEALEASEAREEDEDEDEDENADEDGEAENAADDAPARGAVSNIGPDEEELLEEVARKRRQLLRKYKIQEVIKRRQVMLVQIAKEERGNKGAALTTYLSLAGRYCVLMPNTPRGGGVSRKITNASDRKRLKSAVAEFKVAAGMGLIIRTAGASRTKAEIKRDYEYLLRLWETIRELTLKSSAPALIYEEGNLVKRAIRDMYDKDVEAVLVEGEAAYKEAKGFIKMLMPSHASKVQHYRDDAPLFLRHQVESQLEAIYSPVAQLKSGGYLVINATEALVAIDVNSGKSTKERNIEQTALRTNLEAADEAARQMRLRDLAGLVVIDFIDMEENKNNRAVEKRLKDALKKDRARVQMGRISQFGLMEISRQRRRTSLIEGSTQPCPTCGGTGHVRSVESSTLVALRTLEEEGVRGRTAYAHLACPPEVALYLLNEKREHLRAIERRYDMRVTIEADDDLTRPECRLDRVESRKEAARSSSDAVDSPSVTEAVVAGEALPELEASPEIEETPDEAERSDDERARGGRGRRRRGGRERKSDAAETRSDDAPGDDAPTEAEDDGEGESRSASDGDDDEGGERKNKRRRRGRRGGRNRRRRNGDEENGAQTADGSGDGSDRDGGQRDNDQRGAGDETSGEQAPEALETKAADAGEPDPLQVIQPVEGEDLPASEPPAKRKRPARRKKADAEQAETSEAQPQTGEAPAEDDAPANAEAPPKPKRRRRKKPDAEPETPAQAESSFEPEAKAEAKPEPSAEPEPASEPEPDQAEADVDGEGKGDGGKDDGKDEGSRRRGWWQKSGKIFGLGS